MARTLDEGQPPQRRNWVSPVITDAGFAAAGAFARMGFRDPALVLRWRDIAGAEVARLAQPLKFTDGPSGGALTLCAVPGAALFLAHEKRALCDRINSYLGRVAVVQIKFVQRASLARPCAPVPQKAPHALPPADPSKGYQGPEGLANALRALARRRTAAF